MKRLLLIALMAGGLAFIPAQRSDAQVSVGIGVGYPSYGYRYYPYGYGYGYYPYGYYRPHRYYGYYNGAHVLQRQPLLPPPSESSSLLPILSRCENIDASELARAPVRASSFFVEHVIVYARLGFAGPPSGYLRVLALEPRVREAGEIWQEIAGRVDEDHRE